MTTYAPVFMGAASLTLAGTEYGPIVSSAVFKPTPKTASFTGISGDTTQFVGKPTWTLELSLAQDWTASGLGTYLNANVGLAVSAVLTPTAAGAVFTASVVIVPADIGGAFGEVAQSQISLPVNLQPARTAS